MLMLLFYVGDQAYAIDCQYVFEVVPYIHLEKHSKSLDYVSGLANFEGRPVTVVDFSKLIDGPPATFYLHTRIIFLVDNPESPSFSSLGIIAEKVIEVTEMTGADFFEPELKVTEYSFLDGIANNAGKSIQRVDIEKIFEYLQVNFHDT